jgi:hypothetical protein
MAVDPIRDCVSPIAKSNKHRGGAVLANDWRGPQLLREKQTQRIGKRIFEIILTCYRWLYIMMMEIRQLVGGFIQKGGRK